MDQGMEQAGRTGRVGVGLLGLAHGHVNGYCEEWKRFPDLGVDVVAAWDHDAARLQKAKEAYGLADESSVDELLARKDVAAVVIASETSLHAELAEKAAAAGKSIVLQKPMALTLPEAERIVAAVERHGVPFTMAWQMRADPQNVKMKELLASGELGRVYMVRRRHGLSLGLVPEFASSWHVDPAYNRDIWADDAAHPIDFLHWLLGMPESVTAELASLHPGGIPMDNGIAVFRYDGGPLAEVNCSFVCTAAESTTEIVCEKGTIVQNYGDAVSCNLPRPEGAAGLRWYSKEEGRWIDSGIPTPENHFERIRGLAAPLAEFLRGKRGPLATAREGADTLRMTLATYVSSREGRRVKLDDPAISEV